MHQDFSLPFHGSPRPFYLWHFVCLDDVTPENGATWVIPGSHRAPEITMSRHGDYRHFSGGSAIQLCARAGDIIALNPCCYHDPGVNYSDSGRRRYLAVQMCYITLPSLYDHWVIAGPKLQSAASPRLRMLLGAEVKPAYAHAQAAYVLPEGWETSGNPYCEGINTMGLVPAAQLLREQQARFTTS
jgi:ectoine hydroxylase-related dioxygenase (phytanoyl-CoA dioxygenase family)